MLENAIDYGPAGQTITVRVSPGRLSVTDQGPGLAPGEEDTIFNRFHRGTVGRASRRKGTGLGLPIARELASRWRGSVTLDQRARARRGGDDPAAPGRRHHPERTGDHHGRRDRMTDATAHARLAARRARLAPAAARRSPPARARLVAPVRSAA